MRKTIRQLYDDCWCDSTHRSNDVCELRSHSVYTPAKGTLTGVDLSIEVWMVCFVDRFVVQFGVWCVRDSKRCVVVPLAWLLPNVHCCPTVPSTSSTPACLPNNQQQQPTTPAFYQHCRRSCTTTRFVPYHSLAHRTHTEPDCYFIEQSHSAAFTA